MERKNLPEIPKNVKTTKLKLKKRNMDKNNNKQQHIYIKSTNEITNQNQLSR